MKLVAGADVQINTCEPGDFFGELPLLLGSPAVASLRALPNDLPVIERSAVRLVVVDVSPVIAATGDTSTTC
jgi:CRP-like cAMP-binding protein